MSTIGGTFYDLIDLYKESNDEKLQEAAVVIELLAKTNAVLDDAYTVPCNLGVKHRTTIRTGLPSVTWGQLYRGIPQSKSEKAQVDDTTGFVEGLSSIDKRLLDLAEGSLKGAVRLSEAKGVLEALSQEAASQLIYGNVAVDPEKFTGFAPRFNDSAAANGGQIVDGGGSDAGANTSIWFITWGSEKNHLIYPSGTKAGIIREDKGEQRVLDGSGNPYYALEELFRWHLGLCTRDWRSVARIANINVTDLRNGDVDVYDLMRKAFWKVNAHRGDGKVAIYANADVLEALDAQAAPTKSADASFVRLRPMEIEGKEVLTYRGSPVRQVDAILNTEDPVTFA
jgi:hypothetical protein